MSSPSEGQNQQEESSPTPRAGFLRRIPGSLKSIIAIFAGLAGIISFFYACQERQYDLKDWSRNAMSICERRSHEIRAPQRDSLDNLSTTLAQLSTTMASGTAPDLSGMGYAAASIEDLADALRATVGDFRALPIPQGHKTDINHLLDNGEAYVTSFADLAAEMREITNVAKAINWSNLDASADQVATLKSAMTRTSTTLNKNSSTVEPAWTQSLHSLGIGQCLPTVHGYSVPSEEQTTTPIDTSRPSIEPPFSQQEANLLATLNKSEFEKCSAKPDKENTEIVAALNCNAVRPGPDRRPFIVRVSDPAALSRLADREAAALNGYGDCSRGEDFKGTWSNKLGTVRGTMVCATNEEGYFRIWWAFDTTNIYMVAEAKDSAALYHWWSKGDFLRERADAGSATQ